MKKDAVEIINQIGEIVKGVWTHSENPELLSKDLNDIAVLNWALSQWLAEFEEQERAEKAQLELEKATSMLQFTNEGDAVNKSEIRTAILLAEKRQIYNRLASGVQKIKITMDANSKVMDAARSRLSLIKEQVK